MVYRHFQKRIKFIAMELAAEKLKISLKDFSRLTVLHSVYPVIPESRKSCDGRNIRMDFHYKVADIFSIFNSKEYDNICLKNRIEKEKNALSCYKKELKERNIKDKKQQYINLIKNKFTNFSDSLNELGNTIKDLYLMKILKIEEVENSILNFENFIIKNNLLEFAFLSKKGTYFSINFENIRIVWLKPYPSYNLENFVEEKAFLVKKTKYDLDFLEWIDSDEVEEEENDKLDISILKYSAPLVKAHLETSLYKLNLLYPNGFNRSGDLFLNLKVFINIETIYSELVMILKSEGACLVDESEAEIIITESIKNIITGIDYIQPQYIFDCLNKRKILEKSDYVVGKKLPEHISPFPDALDITKQPGYKTLSNTKKYRILDKIISKK